MSGTAVKKIFFESAYERLSKEYPNYKIMLDNITHRGVLPSPFRNIGVKRIEIDDENKTVTII